MKDKNIYVEASEIFRKAANYIRANGWQVTGMGRHGSPRCSMGALASAHEDDIWDEKLASLMYEVLYKELNGISLTDYNYLHQNGESVAVLFEKVARKLSLNHEQAVGK